MDALTVDMLVETLQEPNRPLLRQVLRTLGPDRCAAILADTLTCEANGGMLTKDGTRRRTPGGVFFQLVKARATRQERRRLFPRPAPPHGQGRPQGQPQAPHGADLGRDQQPHANARHRTTRRGTHDEADTDWQTRQG
jgi:hypothetical protein